MIRYWFVQDRKALRKVRSLDQERGGELGMPEDGIPHDCREGLSISEWAWKEWGDGSTYVSGRVDVWGCGIDGFVADVCGGWKEIVSWVYHCLQFKSRGSR